MNLGEIKDRLLIFGGPYSNLAATRAMRTEAQALGIPPVRVICTGDLVAYCGEPVQTVDLIRDWGVHVVMGNCEESLWRELDDCGCGFEPQTACSTLSITWYRYASQRITPDQRHWMAALPKSIGFEFQNFQFSIIHGGVSSISQFVFPSFPAALKLEQIVEAGVDAVIGGHSGIPFGQSIDNRLWLNAGAVGLPANDGSTDGWYMLIEPDNQGFEVSWHRLAYDAILSRRSTHAAGMHEYAQALTDGLWPSMDVLPHEERRQRGQRLQLDPLRVQSVRC
ncbi:MAG: metallophosphoesterase [Gammaproteobacteria bacterium]